VIGCVQSYRRWACGARADELASTLLDHLRSVAGVRALIRGQRLANLLTSLRKGSDENSDRLSLLVQWRWGLSGEVGARQ
jgi:hypothetical protein